MLPTLWDSKLAAASNTSSSPVMAEPTSAPSPKPVMMVFSAEPCAAASACLLLPLQPSDAFAFTLLFRELACPFLLCSPTFAFTLLFRQLACPFLFSPTPLLHRFKLLLESQPLPFEREPLSLLLEGEPFALLFERESFSLFFEREALALFLIERLVVACGGVRLRAPLIGGAT